MVAKFLFIFFIIFSLPSAFADSQKNNGGWVITGGEVFENARNPWFVGNTKEVNYCILFSDNEFSISKNEVASLVQDSLSYWANQLDGRSALSVDKNIWQKNQTLKLATQKFNYSGSCDQADLTFKFGYKTLNQTEIEHLIKPNKYLGVTIRKTYDEEKLKGSGIIYITGDLGDQSYQKSHKEIISEAWKYPKLLQYVIIHELGHVFGIPHSGSGLMSETFLDTLLIRNFAMVFLREPFLPFLKPQSEYTICDSSILPKGSQHFIGSYFKLNNGEDCLRFEATSNSREFLILTKKFNVNDWTTIGKLLLNQTEVTDFSLKPSMVLKLNEKQKSLLGADKDFLLGPVYQNYKIDGHIVFNGSMKPYSVQIDISPDSFVIFGLIDNKIKQIFKFGNPLLYVLRLPF